MAGSPEFSPRVEPTASLQCEAVADDLAAYAWGALEPDERARVERHRLHCSACDQWLRESEQAVSRVDLAMPKIPPPPELRSRVLASIDATPRAVAPVRPTRAAATETRTAARPRPGLTVANTDVHARPGQRGARRRASPFLAGLTTGLIGASAAALLVVVLIVQPQALNGLTLPRSAFGSPQSGPPAGLPNFLPGPAQSPGRLLELRSPSGSGRGFLLYAADTRRGVLLLEELASPEGTEYTVWLVQGSQRVGLGSTVNDARGVATFTLPEPLSLDHPERIEVVASTGAGPVLSATF